MPTQVTANSHPNDKHKRWEESKKDLFLENLNQNKMNEILNILNDITQPSKDSINAIMTKIEGIFKTTHNNTFSKQKFIHHINKTRTNSKPWFNNKCQQAQQKYHLARDCLKLTEHIKIKENFWPAAKLTNEKSIKV